MLYVLYQLLSQNEFLFGAEGAGYVWAAARFAEEKHGARQRPNGDLQIDHSIRVAIRGAELALAQNFSEADAVRLVQDCLLHDVIEDEGVTHEELAATFGQEVAGDVLALSKSNEEEPDTIYFSRIEARGQFAILAKRCDILDNTEQLANCSADFRARKAAERRTTLPLWAQFDPEGAKEIETTLEQLAMLE